VQHDVQRRAFLEQPAGEDSPPFGIGAARIDLNEGTGILLLLPWRGAFAGAQPDDDIADPNRLARLQRQVAGLAVALVQQADHRHPLRHRRRTGQQAAVQPGIDADHFRRAGIGSHRLGNCDLRRRAGRRNGRSVPALPAEPACDRQPYRDRQPDQPAAQVHASGLHAS
jgi:hypothetical protein